MKSTAFSFQITLFRLSLLFIPLFYFPLLSIFYFVWLLKNWILNLQKIFSQICEQVKNNLASILEKKILIVCLFGKNTKNNAALFWNTWFSWKNKCSSVARMHGAAPSRTACFSPALLTPHFFHVTPPPLSLFSLRCAFCIFCPRLHEVSVTLASALSKMTIQLLRIDMHWQ